MLLWRWRRCIVADAEPLLPTTATTERLIKQAEYIDLQIIAFPPLRRSALPAVRRGIVALAALDRPR